MPGPGFLSLSRRHPRYEGQWQRPAEPDLPFSRDSMTQALDIEGRRQEVLRSAKQPSSHLELSTGNAGFPGQQAVELGSGREQKTRKAETIAIDLDLRQAHLRK